MIKNKKIIYYLTTIAICILLKLYYSISDNSGLFFLLKPTDKIIEIVLNSSSQVMNNGGFFHAKLNILIDKSCSGFNFLIITFIMLSFAVSKILNSRTKKVLSFLILLVISYILTILVNSSRILLSVFLNNSVTKLFDYQLSWLHQAEGSFIYLFFLILIYLSADYFINKLKQKYAKSS